jgi:hypothetical protein
MQASPPPAQGASPEGGLGNILKGSAFVENTPSKSPSDRAKNLGQGLQSGTIQQKVGTSSPSKPKDESNAASMVTKIQSTNGDKPEPPPATQLKTTETAKPVKAPPTRQVATRPVPRSPVVTAPSPKTPTSPKMHLKGGPAKIRGVMESAKQAQKEREAMAKEKEEQPAKKQMIPPKVDTQAKPKPAPVTATATKKQQIPTSPQSVRSPTASKPRITTVPSKLPAAAMATTASAAAKHDTTAQADPERKVATKKPSSLSSRPPRASTASTTSTLAKKASRASLANGHDRPKSRVSTSKPDEGFLARMMRPTASSAQKTHDKVPTSPPRAKRVAVPTKIKQPTKTEGSAKQEVDVDVNDNETEKENEDVHLAAKAQDQAEDTTKEEVSIPATSALPAEPSLEEPEKSAAVTSTEPVSGKSGQEIAQESY